MNDSVNDRSCSDTVKQVLLCHIMGMVIIVGSSACSNDSGAGLVSESVGFDGVREIVTHAVEPFPKPWVLEEDLVIGVEYGDEEYMLRSPLDYLVTEAGLHVILDFNPAQIRIFDTDGSFVRSFGQEGQGPTDLHRLGRRLISRSDTTFDIWGPSRPFRLQSWSVTGTFLDIQSLASDHPMYSNYVFEWDGVHLFTEVYDYDRSPARRWSNLLNLASDWDGSRVDTLSVFSHAEMTREAGMVQASLDYTPGDLTLLTGSGHFLYSQLEEDWIHVLTPGSWQEEFRFRREHEPDSIPDQVIEELIEMTPESYREQFTEGGKWMQEHITAFDIAEGPDGEYWVQRTAWTYESDLKLVDIFSADGVFRGQIEVPFHLNRMKMIDGFIYAIGTSGEAPALVRYRAKKN